MKKPNSQQPDSTEYSFSVAKRAEPRLTVESSRLAKINIWAPLSAFAWDGGELELSKEIWIKGRASYRGFEDPVFSRFLSIDERTECAEAEHWLSIVQPAHYPVSPRASINCFLLALWIAKRTQAHATVRFEESDAGHRTAARILERFRWIEGHALVEVDDADLYLVSRILPALVDCYASGGRLRNALALTFRGCVAGDWQSAIVCYSAAAEAMLTFARGPGVTRRLAAAYSKLAPSGSRQLSAEMFSELYAIRSAIVHGVSYERKNRDENVRALVRFADALRGLWGVVLSSPDIRTVLESEDDRRAQFFADDEVR